MYFLCLFMEGTFCDTHLSCFACVGIKNNCQHTWFEAIITLTFKQFCCFSFVCQTIKQCVHCSLEVEQILCFWWFCKVRQEFPFLNRSIRSTPSVHVLLHTGGLRQFNKGQTLTIKQLASFHLSVKRRGEFQETQKWAPIIPPSSFPRTHVKR